MQVLKRAQENGTNYLLIDNEYKIEIDLWYLYKERKVAASETFRMAISSFTPHEK